MMIQTHAVLLATGVRDHLPDIPGLGDCYGTTVHHCPYGDGWEVSGRRIAAIGDGMSPVGLALSLKTWKTDHLGRSCVPGIYVVGDASRDVQFAVVAASEGAKAGVAIDKALQARAGLTPASA